MSAETNASLHMEHQKALYRLLCEFDRVCKELSIPYFLFAGTLLGAVRHGGFIPWDDDLDVIMLREDYRRLLEEADGVLNRSDFYLQKEFSDHWPMFFSKLRLNGTTCLEKYHPKDEDAHQGIYIDIFPLDRAKKSGLGRKIQFFASKIVISKSLFNRGYDTDSKKKKLFMSLCRLLPLKPFLVCAKNGQEGGEYLHSFFGGASGYGKNVYDWELFSHSCYLKFEGGEFPAPQKYRELLAHIYGDFMTLPPEEERKVKEHVLLLDTENSFEKYKGYRDGMTFDVHTRSIR